MEQISPPFKATPRPWTLRSRPAMVSGDAVPSWVASIPGDPSATFRRKFLGQRNGILESGDVLSWPGIVAGLSDIPCVPAFIGIFGSLCVCAFSLPQGGG